MSKHTLIFYYRGMIERGNGCGGYDWKEGFSQDSEEGRPLYPWNTQKECRTEAKAKGATAVFLREKNKQIA